MKLGDFNGFPSFSKFVQDKFQDVPLLKVHGLFFAVSILAVPLSTLSLLYMWYFLFQGYFTVEQCSLEYEASKGASIDRHIDDCWVWGERIVTVNLLSDSVLTMTPYYGEEWRYNLPLVSTYNRILNHQGEVVNSQIKAIANGGNPEINNLHNLVGDEFPRSTPKDIVVRIPMPRRSLLVIYGSPRYDWEHRVLREDVHGRRTCIAYREFTPPFLPGGQLYNESEEVLKTGNNFWDHQSVRN